MDTVRLKQNAKRVAWLALKGQSEFSAKIMLALVIQPLLEMLEAMEKSKGERWLTLREAARRSGRGKNFFEKPLAALGGKSRLETWADERLAEKTEDGWWLISPLVVAESRQQAGHQDEEADSASAAQKEADDIADLFAA